MTRSGVLLRRTTIFLFACISVIAAAPLNILLANDDGYQSPPQNLDSRLERLDRLAEIGGAR
jgi:hypothetical protein